MKTLHPISLGQFRGLSFVELLLGVALAAFIIPVAVFTLQSMSLGFTSNILSNNVERKIQLVTDQIKKESIGQFQVMDETNRDRTCPPEYIAEMPSTHHLCTDADRKVKILSTISAIDPVYRTRNVTLVAQWNEKNEGRTKTATFILSQLRGKAIGGRILVNVNDIYSGGKVSGVKVSAMGEDRTKVACTSDTDGKCLLSGVKLGTTDLYIDGQPASYYFSQHDPIDCNQAPASWTSIEPVEVLSNANYTSKTVLMCPPGILSGTVKDMGTLFHQGADAVEVHMINKSAESVLPVISPIERIKKTMTTGEGAYELKAPAGKYSVYVIGNKKYAALGRFSDAQETSVNREYVQLVSGQTLNKDLHTIARGSLKLRVRGVTYNDGTYNNPLIINPTEDRFVVIDFIAEHKYLEPTPPNDLIQTTLIWNTSLFPQPETYAPRSIRLTIKDSNWVNLAYCAPRIIDRVAEPSLQRLSTEFGLSTYGREPFTPVIVYPDPVLGLKSPKFKIIDPNEASPLADEIYAPTEIAPAWKNQIIYTNEEYETERYFLTKESFGNITGKLVDENGLDFQIPVDPSYQSFFYTTWLSNGYGSLKEVDIPLSSIDSLYLSAHGQIPADDIRGQSTFDVAQLAGLNPFAPNLGTDVTVLKFTSRSTVSISTTSVLKINFRAEYNQCGLGGVSHLSYDDLAGQPPINYDVVEINASGAQATLLADQIMNFGPSIDNGVGKVSNVASSHFNSAYSGASDPLQVKPGISVNAANIVIQQSTVYNKLMLKIKDDHYWDWLVVDGSEFSRTEFYGGHNLYEFAGDMEIYRVGVSGNISGRVVNRFNQPVAGASVKLTMLGQSEFSIETDTNGNFLFFGKKFTMFRDSDNYFISARLGSVTSGTISIMACDGMDWDVGDIQLDCENCIVSGSGL